MPLIQIFSKVGKYATILLAIFGLVCIGYFVLSPPSGSDDSELVGQLRGELDSAIQSNRELMELKLDLEQELDGAKRTIVYLRSIIDDSIKENLTAGDLIIESGILTDDSLLLIRQLRERITAEE